MKNYIVRKASTRDAINRAITQGKCKTEADVEAIAASLGASEFLREVGVPANIRGCDYLREAVNMVAADKSIIRSVTKILYPAVAEKFQTTPARVERAMRHDVETAWERGDLETIHKRFGYTVSIHKGRPTAGEFVALAAEYVSRRTQ